MKKNFIKFNKIIFTALSLMLIVLCLVGCEGQDIESLLDHEALQNEKYADMVKQIQGGNKTQVEEDIIGGKSNNKDKVNVNDNGLDLVKKDRVDSNGKVWTEIQGEKEKEYTDEYSLNKQEKARLEAKADANKQGELIAKYGGKTYEELYKIGGDEAITELANAGLYCMYDSSHNITFVSKEEITNKLQTMVNNDSLNGFALDSETKKIYEQLQNRKLENQHKEEVKQVDSLIVHLTSPKTVDQLGGNKVGDNKGLYKGEIQQPRKYGNSAYSGSMLVACNSMLGSNYERYYECRNGFIVLKAEGFRIYDALQGTDRRLFRKTEWECFKLNNPNIKVIQSDSDEYYNQKFDYGTFADNGEPMWLEGYNQCVVDFLGNNWFQSGTIIDGQLLTKEWHPNKGTWVDAGYSNGCSHPNCCDSAGNMNKDYSDEMYLANTVEESNAIVRKYMH